MEIIRKKGQAVAASADRDASEGCVLAGKGDFAAVVAQCETTLSLKADYIALTTDS